MPNRLTLAILLSATTLLMQGCAAPPAIPSACGWESVFFPEARFETRWTHAEKLWLAEHNDKVTAFCGKPA